MNMKNATILLIFLLAVVGLIIGVHYTEVDNIEKPPQNNDDLSIEDSNGEVTVPLQSKEIPSFIDNFFSIT